MPTGKRLLFFQVLRQLEPLCEGGGRVDFAVARSTSNR
jgi:hypothetical protein